MAASKGSQKDSKDSLQIVGAQAARKHGGQAEVRGLD